MQQQELVIEAGKTVGRQNLEHIDAFMKKSEILNWVKPGGGYISFPGYDRTKLDMTSVDLCKVLINKPYQVYLVPGTAYGEAHEGHVRVGFGGPHQIITEAFEVIEQFTEEHRK